VTILDRILETKRAEIAAAKRSVPQVEMERKALAAPRPRDFAGAIRRDIAAGRAAVIAEIKRASPSKGLLREPFEPVAIAKSYEAGGATCMSVLTDKDYFMGRPDDLIAARSACGMPALRKDFVIDAYQVYESRAMGADCILLIAACLTVAEMEALESQALGLGMSVLVEVHDADELTCTGKLKTPLIGINNRNLKTFETTLATTEHLAPLIPADRIIVGESGLFTPADLARLERVGVSTFLIGESLMRQADVAAATRALLARGAVQAAE